MTRQLYLSPLIKLMQSDGHYKKNKPSFITIAVYKPTKEYDKSATSANSLVVSCSLDVNPAEKLMVSSSNSLTEISRNVTINCQTRFPLRSKLYHKGAIVQHLLSLNNIQPPAFECLVVVYPLHAQLNLCRVTAQVKISTSNS